ncbi:hypothetical protein Cgig2_006701 [Carnegiea gigantea]|uniref:Transmembrane 9 superfamily member n=1 Tax=Carnegiea gigantea TaxID=171969 RepID=A0A9Q1JSE0_9CARY|nr:hypothetical protein Cgig2_006701 [Carnegiea gigantea]
MREPQMCNIVCRQTLDAKSAKEFKENIDDEYRVNMILDNLPLVTPIRRGDQDAIPVYQLGFYVGLKGQYAGTKDETYFIHNHLAFTVKYHKDQQTETSRIVGFEVKPFRYFLLVTDFAASLTYGFLFTIIFFLGTSVLSTNMKDNGMTILV